MDGEEKELLVYIENSSKNYSGSYKHPGNKIMRHFSEPTAGEQCFIYLFKSYVSKLPKAAFINDAFYWHPKDRMMKNLGFHWYLLYITL